LLLSDKYHNNILEWHFWVLYIWKTDHIQTRAMLEDVTTCSADLVLVS